MFLIGPCTVTEYHSKCLRRWFHLDVELPYQHTIHTHVDMIDAFHSDDDLNEALHVPFGDAPFWIIARNSDDHDSLAVAVTDFFADEAAARAEFARRLQSFEANVLALDNGETLSLLRSDIPFNRARRRFSAATAEAEQACQQRTPLSPIEIRQHEFTAVARIAAEFGFLPALPETPEEQVPASWHP